MSGHVRYFCEVILIDATASPKSKLRFGTTPSKMEGPGKMYYNYIFRYQNLRLKETTCWAYIFGWEVCRECSSHDDPVFDIALFVSR